MIIPACSWDPTVVKIKIDTGLPDGKNRALLNSRDSLFEPQPKEKFPTVQVEYQGSP